jgi:hypothetical protein
MLRDLLTQKCVLISDTPEHVDLENIKFNIGRRSSVYQLKKNVIFTSLNVAKIGKNGPKNEFFIFFEVSHFFNVIVLKLFGCVPRLEKRKNSRKSLKIGQF